MKNLKFKYLAAKNIFCYGNQGLELNFETLGNIVLISGRNGSGKSSIPNILVYALFGRPIKHPKKLAHADIINKKTKKNLYAEVRWDDYRVVRTRKPESLRIWYSPESIWNDETEISKSGIPAVQKQIEEIIGLNYETFINLVVFTDSNTDCFLECDTPTKRQIVENLLDLSKYVERLQTAKESRKKLLDGIKSLTDSYQRLLIESSSAKNRVTKYLQEEETWKQQKKAEIASLLSSLQANQNELKNSSVGTELAAYQEAQDKITELNNSIPDKEKTYEQLSEEIKKYENKKRSDLVEVSNIEISKNKIDSEIRDFEKKIKANQDKIYTIKKTATLSGTVCERCFGIVHEDNCDSYEKQLLVENDGHLIEISKRKPELEEITASLTKKNAFLKKLNEVLGAKESERNKVSSEITSIRSKITELSRIKRPEVGTREQLLEQKIESLKQQARTKKAELDGPSPFVDIIKGAEAEVLVKEQECIEGKKEIDVLEKDIPYYDFWTKGFGDGGIRKLIIDGIIPALNERINYWIQFLMDGSFQMSFDNEFVETIHRVPNDSDPYVYHGMAGGEKRRLNLTISPSFAHIMMLSSGISPSVLFLDEVASNVEQDSMGNIFEMIVQLSRDKQVFVTTHDPGLRKYLESYQRIDLENIDGFTTFSN